MTTPYYIVYTPLNFELMDRVGTPDFSPPDLLSHLSGRDAERIDANNYIAYLTFDPAKERKGLVEYMGMDIYAVYYIANQIARVAPAGRVVIADGRRRHIESIITKAGTTPEAVFISCLSSNFPAAVATAVALNHGRIPVVIGGIHASTRPEDVNLFIRGHVPFPELVAQVRGPGDSGVIRKILGDLRNGGLQPEYFGQTTLENEIWGNHRVVPLPEMRLPFLRKLPLIGHYLNRISRVKVTTPYLGCPYSCSFCSISTLPKGQRRFVTRTPQDFVNELSDLQKSGVNYKNRFFMFLPDNLLLGGSKLEALLDHIIASDVRLNYLAQISIDVADRPNLLKKLRRSGATHFLVGLESLDIRNLEAIGKSFTAGIQKSGMSVADYYGRRIRIIQDHGISFHGSFIFGLPFDYFRSLEDHSGRAVADFCRKYHIGIQASCLNDLPGSRNYDESQRQGSYLYGKQGTMDYLLALCCADLMESNRAIPHGMKNSPLISTYMAYDTARRVNATRQLVQIVRTMLPKVWRAPTSKGERYLKDRFTDCVAVTGFCLGVGAYKDHFEAVAHSRPGNKGIFERLFENEPDPAVKKLFEAYVKQFLVPRGNSR